MKQWQSTVINALKEGASEEDALAAAKVTRTAFEDARQSDVGFRNALMLLEEGVGLEELSPEALRRLRKAQVSETRTAAYFGMTVDEFKQALKEDEELDRVYRLAPLAGQAEIEMMQFESAPDSVDMQKWLGKQHLGQSEKVEQKTEVVAVLPPEELAKKMAFLTAKAGLVIDGMSEPVENDVALPPPNDDNDVGSQVSLAKDIIDGEHAYPDCTAEPD